MTEEKVKTKTMITPCPIYDTESIIDWLEEQAQKGYLLERDGLHMWFAQFEVGEPQNIRYRVEPSIEAQKLFHDSSVDEDDVLIHSLIEYGWRYKAKCSGFLLFYSDDPSNAEYQTDAVARAKAYQKDVYYSAGSIALTIFYTSKFIDDFRLHSSEMSSSHRIAFIIFTVNISLLLILSIYRLVHLWDAWKKAQSGKVPNQNKDWKKMYTFTQVGRIILVLFAITYIGSLFIK